MEEQKKAAYIDLLMELAKKNDGQNGQDRKDLLDRIEHAIGIPIAKSSPEGGEKSPA